MLLSEEVSLKRKSIFIIFLKYFGFILPGQDVVPAAVQEGWFALAERKCFHSVPLKHQDLPKNSDPKGLLQLEVFQKSLFIYYLH